MAGNIDVNPFEIMLTCPPDNDRRQCGLGGRAALARRTSLLGTLLAAAHDRRRSVEGFRDGLSCVALADLGHVLGRSLGNDASASLAAFWSQVDKPVGRLDHVEIVLDDDDGVALRGESVEDLQQLSHVVEVKTSGRLVENVEGPSGPFLDQFSCKLDPLRLAARERRRGLAELQVIEADIVQRLKHRGDFGDIGEVLKRLLNVHLQNVGDALPFEADVQGLSVEPFPLADRAGHPDIGEEIHLQAV